MNDPFYEGFPMQVVKNDLCASALSQSVNKEMV